MLKIKICSIERMPTEKARILRTRAQVAAIVGQMLNYMNIEFIYGKAYKKLIVISK
jgi:hypothetical protein